MEGLIGAQTNVAEDHIGDQSAGSRGDVGVAGFCHTAHPSGNAVDQIDLRPGRGRIIRYQLGVQGLTLVSRNAGGAGGVAAVAIDVRTPAGLLTRPDGDCENPGLRLIVRRAVIAVQHVRVDPLVGIGRQHACAVGPPLVVSVDPAVILAAGFDIGAVEIAPMGAKGIGIVNAGRNSPLAAADSARIGLPCGGVVGNKRSIHKQKQAGVHPGQILLRRLCRRGFLRFCFGRHVRFLCELRSFGFLRLLLLRCAFLRRGQSFRLFRLGSCSFLRDRLRSSRLRLGCPCNFGQRRYAEQKREQQKQSYDS